MSVAGGTKKAAAVNVIPLQRFGRLFRYRYVNPKLIQYVEKSL